MMNAVTTPLCAQPGPLPACSSLPAAFRPSAGEYLRMRREAAGLSRDEAAHRACVSSAALGRAEQDIEAVPGTFILALRNAFGIDDEIYANLAEGRAVRSICSGCGCSWFDPCADRHKRPCAWTDASATECTACAERECTEDAA